MDKIFKKRLIVILTLIVAFASCRKKEFDAYYGRPDGLADPIYQQLQARGNFTTLLACIDKAQYKEILSTAGFWTLFAPNDDAFKVYFQEKGLNSIDQLADSTATNIIRYALSYDANKTDHLGDYLSATGWKPNLGFRRRTTYYDFVYDGTVNGKKAKVISSNGNGTYVYTNFNNKYITYFISNAMSAAALGATDYNYFFPNTAYSGFNVVNASVKNKDIVAENGVIHEVDHVIEPMKTLDQYVASKAEYTEFKKLLDLFVTYSPSNEATHRYQVLSGKADSVYVKYYNALLGFSPNNESFTEDAGAANNSQTGAYTLFVPRNEELLAYERDVLLKYYPGKTMKDLFISNQQVLIDFLNAHMYKSMVWPSKFSNATAALTGEVPQFNPGSDVIDKKLLSNGLFYGVSKVQNADVFSTVFGKAYLNPAYLTTSTFLNEYGLYTSVKNSKIKANLIMMSDATLTANGYYYNPNYLASSTITGRLTIPANGDFKRVLQQAIIPASHGEMSNLLSGGAGIVETLNGEYIKYDNLKIYSSGTLDSTDVTKQYVSVNSALSSTDGKASNGYAFFVNKFLSFTTKQVSQHIIAKGTLSTDPFYSFSMYLKGSSLYNATTFEINGVPLGVNYTVFVPNNAAIVQAVKDGVLPGDLVTGAPTYAPTNVNDIAKINRFIQYHIISGNTIVPDGLKAGLYKTLYKDSNGNDTYVTITNSLNSMQVKDMKNSSPLANVVISNSNVLSNRTVIHQLDRYLKFDY
ncbi:fasciclin domain-containing protein [Pedobacter sp. MC2016-24]|uniref:fasciclin domain-containing protein n=1 Tax=Pedobacter sp. MC2016-24 TaxID=2780090 RepID=UPI001880CDA0|nr:fasciclin domain-containing protein [Pedobacter sp. MC2016-24]MBE9599755.1 fasciclin domain-containing protein [Pedobacter sp. MC2016-24]